MDYSPASYFLLHTPRLFRGLTKTVFHAEGPMATIVNPPRLLKLLVGGVLPNCDVHTGITEFVARDMARALDRELKYVLPVGVDTAFFTQPLERNHAVPDRKSTRLNSSHANISYAVFCLKKKKIIKQ